MKVRYLIKYSKENEIKFISHLDLMRTIQRTIKRAGLPIEYSKGFNPHMTISIAQPLSVGVYSRGEYLDTVFTEELSSDEIVKRLNNNSPMGIKFLDAKKVKVEENKKTPQSMAIIDAALYKIKVKAVNGENALKEIEKLNEKSSWMTIRKSKKGDKDIDIKPLIKDIKYINRDNNILIDTMIACGSRENLSAKLLIEYIEENVESLDKSAFVDIERINMYAIKDNDLIPLNEYL